MKKQSIGTTSRTVTFALSDFSALTKWSGLRLQRIVGRHITDADMMSVAVTDADGLEHFGFNYQIEPCDVRPDIVIPIANQEDVITITQSGSALDNALFVWASAIGG